MSYTDDAELLHKRLEEAGLLRLTEQMKEGTLNRAYIVEGKTVQEKNRFKFLIYSFLRLNGLTRTYRVKWEGPLALRVVPDVNKARMHEAATAMQQEREIPAGYIQPNMGFLDMDDEEVVKSALEGEEDKL